MGSARILNIKYIQFLAKRPKQSLPLNSFSVALKYPSPYPTPTSIVLLLHELYLKYSVDNLLSYNTPFDTLEWKVLTIRTENWDFLWHSHFNWEFTAKFPARPLLQPWNWQGQTLFHATIFSLFGGVYRQLATVRYIYILLGAFFSFLKRHFTGQACNPFFPWCPMSPMKRDFLLGPPPCPNFLEPCT